jgi:hypothetical protein
MNSLKRKLYAFLVNQNQYFQYGRTWFNIPWNILAVTSQVGVLLIYLGLERENIILLLLSGAIITGIYIAGRFLFTVGGQQADRLMNAWRNPAYALIGVITWYSVTLQAEKMHIPVPDSLKEFGVTEWHDAKRICEFVLENGRRAGAVPLSKKLMGDLQQ